MTQDQNSYWNEGHRKYSKTDWIDKPTLFLQSIISLLPSEGTVLDAGCGQGQDSRYFTEHGFKVTAIDFSEEGLKFAIEKSSHRENKIDYQHVDLTQPLPFDNSSFDIVYSHLAIHYFTEKITRQIFSEFNRILKPGGVLALLVNSTTDPEYGTGPKIEDDYFNIRGVTKRYFSTESLRRYVHDFEITLLDDAGETYKDRAMNVTRLIRFIGKKKI